MPVSPVFRTGSEPLLSPRLRPARPTHLGSAPPAVPASKYHLRLAHNVGSSLHPDGACAGGGGGARFKGSDGQLHTRAPPKPLRVSAVFRPFAQRDCEPSPLYDELVVQVKPSAHYTCRRPIICELLLLRMSCCDVQVPQSRQRGHVDRLRAEQKWQSRARLTETFLEAQNNEGLLELLLPARESALAGLDDWHFQKPRVCHFSPFLICVLPT